MQPTQVVVAVVTGAISIAAFVICGFQARQRGPVFTNTWLLGNAQEREKIDKPAEYRLARNIFFGVGIVFALCCAMVLTGRQWILFIIIPVIVALVAYVIVVGVRSGEWR